MEQTRIQFYTGKESQYISMSRPREGHDVAFNSKFVNCVFFAKDTGVIYVNGIRYGYCNTLGLEAFTTVHFQYPDSSTAAKIIFNKDEDSKKEISLFRIYSGTPNTIKVDVDENHNYKISLDLKDSLQSSRQDSSNLIAVDSEGQMGVFLGIDRDVSNAQLNFYGYDANGEKRIFGSVDETRYTQDTFLKDVSLFTKNEEGVNKKYLNFRWNRDITGITENETVIGISLDDMFGDFETEVKGYKINGKNISSNPVLSGKDISIGSEDFKYDENGVIIYDFDVNDSITLTVEKLKHRYDSSVNQFSEDIAKLKKDVSGLKTISNVEFEGNDDGDFVSNVTNNQDTSVITVSKGYIVDATLKGYDSSTGLFNETTSIGNAIQELDESLVWKDLKTEND